MTRAGDCSETMSSATFWQYTSQSGFAMANGPVKSGLEHGIKANSIQVFNNFTYDCIFNASKTRMAFRTFPPESSTILLPASGGRSKPTRLATYRRTVNICQKRNVSMKGESTKSKQYFVITRSSNAHEQTTTLNRSDKTTCAVGTKNYSQV